MGKFGKRNHVSLNPLDANICLLGTPKVGKEQPVSEPVLTEKGWTPMGDIKVGDCVYGEDGNLYNVTGVYPQGVKDVYEVTFRDGTKTRCGLEHLWTVSTIKQRNNARRHNDVRNKVLTLQEIMVDYKHLVNKGNGMRYEYKYSVPVNDAINFVGDKCLPVSPYALGLLLGDGGFTGSVITFTNAEDELFTELEDELKPLGIEMHTRDYEHHKQCTLCCNEHYNSLRNALNMFELLGRGSREKFIPKQYMYTSVENRYAILSGIVNTDGHVSGKRIIVDTYSEQLASDIAEIVRSLGMIATIKIYDRTNEDSTNRYDKEIEYRVNIISDDYSKFHLSSKHKAALKDKDVQYVKSITNIELVGKEECQCIMVDNPNHMYITNEYIVTHNTTLMKEVAEELVGVDGYLFLEMYRENGAKYIEDIVYENVPDWETFIDIIDDIVDNRTTEYADLKVVFIDTLDNAIQLAEQESLRIWNKENPTKRVTSINAAWGGFQKGQDKACDLLQEQFFRLRNVGIAPSYIGHVRTTNVTDPVTLETYQQLTSDVTQRYFGQIKKNIDLVALAYIDRDIVAQRTGKKNIVNGKEEVVNKVSSEVRKIKFRDSNYAIDSGGRFRYIVDECEFAPDAFIKAMRDALEAEVKNSGKSIDDRKKEDVEREKHNLERVAKQEEAAKQQKELDSIVSEIVEFFTENKSDMDKIKPVLTAVKNAGYANPKEITSIDDAKAILALTLK